MRGVRFFWLTVTKRNPIADGRQRSCFLVVKCFGAEVGGLCFCPLLSILTYLPFDVYVNASHSTLSLRIYVSVLSNYNGVTRRFLENLEIFICRENTRDKLKTIF